MGTVSDDGRNIIPDPGVGKPKFCCGASLDDNPPPSTGDGGCKDSCVCSGGGGGSGGGSGGNSPGCGGGGIGDPVDPYSGVFTYSESELAFPPPSIIRVERLYNSGNTNVGPFGRGTNMNYERFLLTQGNNALTYITPDGSRYILSKNADGSYTNGMYPFLRGVKGYLNADNTKTLKLRDGWTYTFTDVGWLIREEDNNGNWVSLPRDYNTGKITDIYDNLGNHVSVTIKSIPHGATTYYVISSLAFGTKVITYSYGANERLTSVTDPEGNVTSYTYDSFNRVVSIINKRGITQVTNVYDSNGRVIRQTHADGGVFNIDYTVVGGTVTETKEKRPDGSTTVYRFNNAGYR